MADHEINNVTDGDISRDGGLVTCFGEMLVDFVPTKAGLSLADAVSYERAAGGAPANVAVGIARLGGQAAFVGKVGDDGFGHMLAGVLRSNGVDCKGIRFDGEARTALAFVSLREDGEREFMFYRNPSADMLLTESELDAELIRKSAVFHYGSISLISEPCRTAHLAAMRIAKGAGALLSYDANLRLQLWPSAEAARRGILSVWSEADIIKVSDDEVGFLCGEAALDVDAAALRLMNPATKLLLLTEGARGCRYYTPEFRGHVESVKVAAVDTTGAGDAFMGGILSQIALRPAVLSDEEGLREAIAFANACGAITTTSKGAIPALPDRAAVLQLLQNRA